MEWRFAGRVDVILLCTWCEESRKKVVFGQREDKDRNCEGKAVSAGRRSRGQVLGRASFLLGDWIIPPRRWW